MKSVSMTVIIGEGGIVVADAGVVVVGGGQAVVPVVAVVSSMSAVLDARRRWGRGTSNASV